MRVLLIAGGVALLLAGAGFAALAWLVRRVDDIG